MALQKTLTAPDTGASGNYNLITRVVATKNVNNSNYTLDVMLNLYVDSQSRINGKASIDKRDYKIPATQSQIDDGIKLSDLYDWIKANDAAFSDAIDV